MMSSQILPPYEPETELYEQSYDVILDDAEYEIALRWNVRTEAWYLTLTAADGTVLVAARKLTVSCPVTWRLRREQSPGGLLMLVDTSGAREPATLASLGWRHQLWYIAAADLPAAPAVDYTIEVPT